MKNLNDDGLSSLILSLREKTAKSGEFEFNGYKIIISDGSTLLSPKMLSCTRCGHTFLGENTEYPVLCLSCKPKKRKIVRIRNSPEITLKSIKVIEK